MNLELKNKNAIVCGSTQGIGEASAIELAKLGANVTLIARNESKLLNVLNSLDVSQGQSHSFVCVDFLDTDKLKLEINLLTGVYHILVNNTGGPAGGPITDAASNSFEQAFKMHLINNQVLAQKVITGMKKEGFGKGSAKNGANFAFDLQKGMSHNIDFVRRNKNYCKCIVKLSGGELQIALEKYLLNIEAGTKK